MTLLFFHQGNRAILSTKFFFAQGPAEKAGPGKKKFSGGRAGPAIHPSTASVSHCRFISQRHTMPLPLFRYAVHLHTMNQGVRRSQLVALIKHGL